MCTSTCIMHDACCVGAGVDVDVDNTDIRYQTIQHKTCRSLIIQQNKHKIVHTFTPHRKQLWTNNAEKNSNVTAQHTYTQDHLTSHT
jgi:hypothetical protein